MVLFNIINDFLMQCLNNVISTFLEGIRDIFGNLFQAAFFIEKLDGLDENVLGESIISRILTSLYAFMILLLALKLVWKGIQVYILWRDGEAESSPVEMLLGAALAMAVALAFPLVYEGAVKIVMQISAAALQYVGVSDALAGEAAPDVLALALNLVNVIAGGSVMILLLGIVFLIVMLILVFKLLTKGVELLLWRLGVPFAVVGLVNSDGGAFKAYAQVLMKELATVLAQYFLLDMGMRLAASGTLIGLLVGIAMEAGGISAPKIMQQFMSPSGGGGMSQKIYTVAMVARAFGG